MNKRFNLRSIGLLLLPILLSSGNSVNDDFSMYEEIIPGTELNIQMIPINGGRFLRGSPEGESGRDPDEGPVREIDISPFWMSSLEITWDQYEVFLYRNMDNIPHPSRGDISLDIDGVSGATMPYVNFNKPGYPVVNITQYAASVFCEWLTARTGRFYRLPTEAEWEYACRAGIEGPYSFKEGDPEQYAWFAANSNQTINRGGMKEPNPWGLYDMHGNAAEWVLDSYDPNGYTAQDTSDPLYRKEKLYPHVVRGGSWRDELPGIRSAAREHSDPSWKKRDPQFPKSLWWHTDALHVGFRIVRPVDTPDETDWEKYRLPEIKDY